MSNETLRREDLINASRTERSRTMNDACKHVAGTHKDIRPDKTTDPDIKRLLGAEITVGTIMRDTALVISDVLDETGTMGANVATPFYMSIIEAVAATVEGRRNRPVTHEEFFECMTEQVHLTYAWLENRTSPDAPVTDHKLARERTTVHAIADYTAKKVMVDMAKFQKAGGDVDVVAQVLIPIGMKLMNRVLRSVSNEETADTWTTRVMSAVQLQLGVEAGAMNPDGTRTDRSDGDDNEPLRGYA